jgi:hypothetical protein
MRGEFVKRTIGVAIAIVLFGFAPLGLAQDKPADNMQILRDKIKADKKLLVATNMELTESNEELLAGLRRVSKGFTKDQSTVNHPFGELRRRFSQQVAHRRQGKKIDR